jgi:hypothetical protein
MGIQIGGEAIENFLTNMVLEKKRVRGHMFLKYIFPYFFTWEWSN